MAEPVSISAAAAAAAANIVAAIEKLLELVNTVSKMPDGEAQMIIRSTQRED